jgi:hypothetical protein
MLASVRVNARAAGIRPKSIGINCFGLRRRRARGRPGRSRRGLCYNPPKFGRQYLSSSVARP